jgi:two-component system, NarL family, sensor kinase
VAWALPAAIAVAVLRYRLYDLDRLVNRTLVYATLTVLLGGCYAGLVLGLASYLAVTPAWP